MYKRISWLKKNKPNDYKNWVKAADALGISNFDGRSEYKNVEKLLKHSGVTLTYSGGGSGGTFSNADFTKFTAALPGIKTRAKELGITNLGKDLSKHINPTKKYSGVASDLTKSLGKVAPGTFGTYWAGQARGKTVKKTPGWNIAATKYKETGDDLEPDTKLRQDYQKLENRWVNEAYGSGKSGTLKAHFGLDLYRDWKGKENLEIGTDAYYEHQTRGAVNWGKYQNDPTYQKYWKLYQAKAGFKDEKGHYSKLSANAKANLGPKEKALLAKGGNFLDTPAEVRALHKAYPDIMKAVEAGKRDVAGWDHTDWSKEPGMDYSGAWKDKDGKVTTPGTGHLYINGVKKLNWEDQENKYQDVSYSDSWVDENGDTKTYNINKEGNLTSGSFAPALKTYSKTSEHPLDENGKKLTIKAYKASDTDTPKGVSPIDSTKWTNAGGAK